MLAFIAVVLAQGAVYRMLALRGLTYSCTILHKRIFEGETNELLEVIENRKLLPLLWMKVETRFSETMLFTKNDNTRVSAGVFHRSVLTIPPLRRIKRVYKIVCTKRGYYPLGSATVTTGDLLGMVNKSLSYVPESGLYVYPVPLPQNALNLPARSFLGDVIVKRFFLPDPFMPAGIRDYMPGDPQNLVNWKASAKSGKLVVQKRDFTSDSKLLVFFNVDYNAKSWDNTGPKKTYALEHAVRLLATVLDFSISYGQQTALRTNAVSLRNKEEVTVKPAMGKAHREELFSAMAEIQFVHSRSFQMLLKEASEDVRGFDILLMTRYTTDEILAESDALRRAGNKVEILLIPDYQQEQQPPEGGELHA
jgi:uncharacterized protein (DUF58 family)